MRKFQLRKLSILFQRRLLILMDLERRLLKSSGLLNCETQDIFNLNYNKIESLEGWGKQSTLNLKYSIEERKNVS